MKLIFKGNLKGGFENLPDGGLKDHPDAVPFKECTDQKKMELRMNVWSVVVLVIMLAAALLVNREAADHITLGFIIALLTMVPHELLHAVCFRETVYMYVWNLVGMFVYAPESISKRRFVFMSILPNLVFGFIPFLVFLIFPQLTILGVMGAMCISMGVGDYYNIFNGLTQMPGGSVCFMEKQRTYWYMPENNAGETIS